MAASELRAAISAHRAARPDHLAAKAPNAPEHLYREWVEWAERLEHLKTQLGMAESSEHAGWRDADGNPVQPAPWKGGTNIHEVKNFQRRKQENAEAKKVLTHSERGKMGGRARSENPSKDALRKREYMARKNRRRTG